MRLLHRHRELSEETQAAQRDSQAMVAETRLLIERANVVAAELEAHRQSNGFSELIAKAIEVSHK